MRAASHCVLIVVIFFLSAVSFVRAETQQAGINARGIVESAEISGIDEDEISQDIRDAVRKLTGKPFDQQTADDLIQRIQIEKPEFVATTRLLAGEQPDRLKVVFLVETVNPEGSSEGNVISR